MNYNFNMRRYISISYYIPYILFTYHFNCFVDVFLNFQKHLYTL